MSGFNNLNLDLIEILVFTYLCDFKNGFVDAQVLKKASQPTKRFKFI